MLGAMIGDSVGSVYEFNNIKTTDFPLFSARCNYTDDSVMTFAVAQWLLNDQNLSQKGLEKHMVSVANNYTCPMGGYGDGFYRWLFTSNERRPYNSWGNGSAMRVSSVGWFFSSLEETERVAKISAEITHNHPEGIKGAQATAAAIYLARTGKGKAEIKEHIENKYKYNLDRTCNEIRPSYQFNESCQGTVPEAIIAFLESTDFESAIRLGVSLGGDSDTLCCITGAIAEAFYKEIPQFIVNEMVKLLPTDFIHTLNIMKEKTYYSIMKHNLSRITPDFITDLKANEIFVFGSNLAGRHGGGAARTAVLHFGAIMGQGVGLQGQSYAIPTMQGGIETIRPYVNEFIEFAKKHPDLKFYVTKIGCGIAGFSESDISPLFETAHNVENIWLPLGW